MKMNKTTAITAAILAGSTFASAQEELSVSISLAYESDYVFRGVALAEDYFAPSVDITYGDMYAGIWAALPTDSEYGDEVDFYAGYGFSVSELVSADLGFTYYTYPDSADGLFDGDVNTFEIYAGLSFEAPLSPSVYVFYDLDLEAFTLETSAGQSWEVSESTAIELAGYLGYVDASGIDSYFYYGAGLSYSIAMSETASASIGVNWYGSEEDMGDGDKNKVTVGGSISLGF